MTKVTLALLMAFSLCGQDVKGPVQYTKSGVKLDGKLTRWKSLKSLHETDPDFDALRAEYRKKSSKVADAAGSHSRLARWCRENRLDAEARQEFTKAIDLDPEHESARKGMGFAKVGDTWKPAGEIYHRKAQSLKVGDVKGIIKLADWCREHSLFDEERRLLASVLAKDGWNKQAIKRIRAVMVRRLPKTLLRPPMAGRWHALPDKTKHHQLKVWAISALDLVKVNSAGILHTGSGKELTDYYGWDQPIYAAADGEVTYVISKYKDMRPGVGGRFEEANAIQIRHINGEYTNYGHLRQGSAKVKVGDRVKKGQHIANIGNSGASGLPHLHFDMSIYLADGTGRGMWIGVPYRFENFTLVKAVRTPCKVQVKVACPQEGWIMEFPRPGD
jgi:murein DD-endopeptidase MepM/ murein hydrolase activator NlpD